MVPLATTYFFLHFFQSPDQVVCLEFIRFAFDVRTIHLQSFNPINRFLYISLYIGDSVFSSSTMFPKLFTFIASSTMVLGAVSTHSKF